MLISIVTVLIYQWSKENLRATINLWYDSATTSEAAIKKTSERIQQHHTKNPKDAPIQLKDIRSLAHVRENPDVFKDKIPVYFRVDLLRAIIAHHSHASENIQYVVCSDLDINPLSEKQLFDEETLKQLATYGIVMAKSPNKRIPYENGFQITSNNSALLEAMDWVLIQTNIARAKNALTDEGFANSAGKLYPNRMDSLEQVVHDSYKQMMGYYYQLTGKGHLTVPDENRSYKKEDGLDLFGLFSAKDMYYLKFQKEADTAIVSKSEPIPPIKDVQYPPSRFDPFAPSSYRF